MDMAHTSSTPSIRIYDSGSHDRHPLPRRSSHISPAAPMAIPNARDSPPPPLPPPRHISELNEGHDTGWQWGNSPDAPGFGRTSFGSVKPGSSLFGGYTRTEQDRLSDVGVPPDFEAARRASSISTVRPDADMIMDGLDHSDEDRDGSRRPSLANFRLQSERQLGQRSLENSSQAYDKQLLSKIGGPNTPNRSSVPNLLSTSASDASPNTLSSFNKLNGKLKPLSMPERRHSSLESPVVSRWPQSGAVSPGQSGFRSPLHEPSSADTVHSRRLGSISTPGGFDQIGCYDPGLLLDPELAEENGMRELNINDRSPSISEDYQTNAKAGSKRRASSPPTEATREERATGGSNDLYHRRSQQMLGNRSSPVSRFHPSHGSVSSTHSSLSQRTGSYASSYGLSVQSIASSATSYSEQRVSPGGLSPGGLEPDFGPTSPYSTGRSLNPSPRLSSISGRTQPESSQTRKMSAESLSHSRQNSVSRMQSMFICECCPKKPKKFETEEELRNHELEKQYTCQYCPNRFKNKNEAERHQNSLHLRRHSWSCAALSGPHAAFHRSTVHPTAADVCGYCGEEFPNPPNWHARADHLNHVHKFGECNQAKKFFRADHFRQHLKHSHAGTSGKWTNMLENACMKDEPAPAPPSSKERVPSVSVGGGLVPGGVNKQHVIEETRNEL